MKINLFSGLQTLVSAVRLFTLSVIFAGTLLSTKCNGQAAILVAIFGDKIATEKFHTSIDGGINLSTMNGLDDAKRLPGLYFGLGTFLKLNDKWALTPEFKPLSQQGARDINPLIDHNLTVNDVKYSIRFNYLDIPVLARYNFKPNMYFAAGPQISFLLSAKQITKGIETDTGTEITLFETCKDSFNPLNFAIPIEFGYSIPEIIPGKGVDLKVRYNIGLADVCNNSSFGSSRLSTWQFFISLPFIKKAGS